MKLVERRTKPKGYLEKDDDPPKYIKGWKVTTFYDTDSRIFERATKPGVKTKWFELVDDDE